MHWYTKVLSNYFTIKGRACRTEYWMFALFNLLGAFSINIFFVVLGMASLVQGAVSLLHLFVLIPSITVGIRRMHDTNRSGWWLLLPFVNLIFLCLPGNQGPNRYGADPTALEVAPSNTKAA
jgi:uncharacterized membrane protein YhaH (DUF805 family)